jgi:hypothetical protein
MFCNTYNEVVAIGYDLIRVVVGQVIQVVVVHVTE